MKSKEGVCEEEVFTAIYKELAGQIHKFLYYKFGPPNRPEDMVQDAFSKLWDNCADVPPTKAKSFLFTVANNLSLNVIARANTALKYQVEEKPRELEMEDPQFQLEENEYMDRIQIALSELTEEQRITLMLNRVEGMKHKEIAEILGISAKAVEKRIYKALEILRKKLPEFD